MIKQKTERRDTVEEGKMCAPKGESLMEKLILENKTLIRRTVQNALGSEYAYLAEEAVAELYLLACEKQSVIEAHPCPRAWLVVAARHVSQGLMKKHQADTLAVPIDEHNVCSAKDSVYNEVLYKTWLENKLPEKLLALLTDKERAVYYAYYVEKKKPKQIAAEQGIPTSSVYGIRNRLKEKIEEKIKK